MKIAIASGKGGVGKTTFAAALALTAARQGRSTAYADCDVEAPNGHLLLQPALDQPRSVVRTIPSVDDEACGLCGACERACQFGAIVCVGDTVHVNPTLCKSCGACGAVCPRQAIHPVERAVGCIQSGRVESLTFVRGMLNIGEARSIPVIDAVKAAVPATAELVVYDAPPGTSCPMIATARGSDLVVLVAEATRFGQADLTIAADAIQATGLRAAVVVNRSDRGDGQVLQMCRARGLPVLADVPYSRALAASYAEADMNGILDALGSGPAEVLERLAALQKRRAS